MHKDLRLDRVRGVLVRLEETIIFGLIERAQFRQNLRVYEAGGLGEALGDRSLLDFLLHECECSHARVRRYASPDEHPFFDDLPEPVLPPLDYSESPLYPNRVNINARIRDVYEKRIVPSVCRAGDDQQYGSSAVCDVNLLQSLSRRIHYAKFVAESKYREQPAAFDALIAARDAQGLLQAVTVPSVEARLFERVERKASTYGSELAAAGEFAIPPASVSAMYRQWIVPLSKDVEVQYLLAHPPS